MTETAIDSRGREYGVGAQVAFNRSGYVVAGTVVHITRGRVDIEPDEDFLSPRSGWPAVSKVKNRDSILVIA